MSDIDLILIDNGTIDITITDDGTIDLSFIDDGIINLTLDGNFSTFTLLTDTPISYSGQAGNFPQVNAVETELEFTDATMGKIVHGATAGTTRPAGFGVVTWIGSVEPSNAVNNDLWIDTN